MCQLVNCYSLLVNINAVLPLFVYSRRSDFQREFCGRLRPLPADGMSLCRVGLLGRSGNDEGRAPDLPRPHPDYQDQVHGRRQGHGTHGQPSAEFKSRYLLQVREGQNLLAKSNAVKPLLRDRSNPTEACVFLGHLLVITSTMQNI